MMSNSMANMRHPDKRCLGAWVDKDLYVAWQKECEHLNVTLTDRVTTLLLADLKQLTLKRLHKAKGRGGS